jgi:hypothetical protein
MLKTNIVDSATGREAKVARTPFGSVLATVSIDKLYSNFKSAVRAAAGTSVVVQPRSGEAIALTDILISAEKAAGNLTIQFTDGTYTVILFGIALTDAPASFGVPLSGRWMGWRDARLEMTTDAAFGALVAVGYTRVQSNNTLSYAEWDAER